jgi:hypothetical protein
MVIASLLVGTLIGIGVGYLIWGTSQGETMPAPPAGATDAPAIVTRPVVHGDPALPQPDDHTTGVLRIVIPPDTGAHVDPSKPREIFVYIDENPRTPPRVRSEVVVQTTFSPVVDPWLSIQPRLMVGASGSFDGYVSPWAGVRLVQLFQRVNIGAGLDRTAAGVFCSYTFFREFQFGVQWYILPIREGAPRAGIVFAYRF